MNYTRMNKREDLLLLLKQVWNTSDKLQFVSCELGDKAKEIALELTKLIEKV